MKFDPCRCQVECPKCKMRIDIPRQSPLGKFPNLENLPKGEWPANFLCPACEQVFSCSFEEVLDVVAVVDPGQPPLGLLRAEYAHDQQNFGERLVIYTPCSTPNAKAAEIEKIRKYAAVAGMAEILRTDVIPFQ